MIPEQTRTIARQVVHTVVKQPERRLAERTRATISGAGTARHAQRPQHADIDWNRTILAILKHYSPPLRRIIPATSLQVPDDAFHRRLHHVAPMGLDPETAQSG
jgi:hypothetical protein